MFYSSIRLGGTLVTICSVMMSLLWFCKTQPAHLALLTEWIDSFVPYYTVFILLYICYQVVILKFSVSKQLQQHPPDSPKSIVKDAEVGNYVNLNFNGTYKLIQNFNVQAILAAQGMGYVRRKLADAADVIQAISISETNDSQHTIAFYVHASVKGRGQVTKNVVYDVNSKESKRMEQKETGLAFFDKVSFMNDGIMKMTRIEENNQFELVVLSSLENSEEHGCRMISESILTLRNGKVVKAKRIFQKLNESGENLTNVGKFKSNPQSTQSNEQKASITKVHPDPNLEVSSETASFSSSFKEGTYTNLNSCNFLSRLETGESIQSSLQNSEYKLQVSIDKNTLHIQTPNRLDIMVDIHNREKNLVSNPKITTIGNVSFESVATCSSNTQGEVVVKRKCMYPSKINEGNESSDDLREKRLNEMLEIYKWSEKGEQLVVKTTYTFESEEKADSIQIFSRDMSMEG